MPSIPNLLWQFWPSEEGGVWKQVIAAPNSYLSFLARPSGGLSAWGTKKGFLLGGYRGDYNTDATEGEVWPVLPGLVTYDMMHNRWSNDSSAELPNHAVAIYGGMHFVPTFGRIGVLIAAGGQAPYPALKSSTDSPIPLSQIFVYDIAEKKWYVQPTTASTSEAIPLSRTRFCMTGAESNKGTYEL